MDARKPARRLLAVASLAGQIPVERHTCGKCWESVMMQRFVCSDPDSGGKSLNDVWCEYTGRLPLAGDSLIRWGNPHTGQANYCHQQQQAEFIQPAADREQRPDSDYFHRNEQHKLAVSPLWPQCRETVTPVDDSQYFMQGPAPPSNHLTRCCTSIQSCSGLPISCCLRMAAASGARQMPLSLTNITSAYMIQVIWRARQGYYSGLA